MSIWKQSCIEYIDPNIKNVYLITLVLCSICHFLKNNKKKHHWIWGVSLLLLSPTFNGKLRENTGVSSHLRAYYETCSRGDERNSLTEAELSSLLILVVPVPALYTRALGQMYTDRSKKSTTQFLYNFIACFLR